MTTKQNLPHKDKGFRLSEARKILGYTQEELADVSEISLGSISAYERGLNLPKLIAIQKLRKVGINMEYVLHGSGEPLLNKQSIIPIQQSRSPALQIEETTAGYDLGPPKVKPQNDSNSHELAEMQAKMEVLKMQAELAQKDAEVARVQVEAAKAQARAEIAEAKQQLLQSQMDDLKNTLKRTEHELAQTKVTLSKVHNQLSTGDKQNKVA